MSRLSDLAKLATLQEYAQGAAQEGVAPVADFLAPTVEVGNVTGLYKVYTEKNRFRVPKTERAVGGRATVLGFDASDKTYNCKPHALDVPIDQMEGMADGTLSHLTIDFARLPLIAVAGAVLYGESIDASVLAGAAIIFAGNYINVWAETRRARS